MSLIQRSRLQFTLKLCVYDNIYIFFFSFFFRPSGPYHETKLHASQFHLYFILKTMFSYHNIVFMTIKLNLLDDAKTVKQNENWMMPKSKTLLYSKTKFIAQALEVETLKHFRMSKIIKFICFKKLLF